MNTGRGTDASQLNASSIFDFAFKLIREKANSNDVPGALITTAVKPVKGGTTYGVRVASDDHAVVLLSAASDKALVNATTNNAGTTPLPVILKEIRQLQTENPHDSYIIPLAECNSVLGFSRQHWTLLFIHHNECYFFDSKSDSLWPSEMSASGFYSLEPIRQFIAENNNSNPEAPQLNFSSKNLFYSDWQEQADNVNCGRYCAEIASRLALKVLIGVKDVNAIKLNLFTAKPDIQQLIAQSSQCETHQLIMPLKEFTLPSKLNVNEVGSFGLNNVADSDADDFVDMKSEGLNANNLNVATVALIGGRSNSVLIQRKQETGFFEKGDGGFKQFRLDFERLAMKLQDKSYAEIFSDGDKTTVEKVAENAGLNADRDRLENIIAACSQGPSSLVPFVLGYGLRTSNDVPQILITQPAAVDVRITLTNEIPQLTCEYAKLPIKNCQAEDNTKLIAGFIDGPIKATFTLAFKNECWGWQLQTIESENSDVIRMMQGEMLPEQHIMDTYCKKPSNVVILDANKLQSDAINEFYLDEGTKTELKKLKDTMVDLQEKNRSLSDTCKALKRELAVMTHIKESAIRDKFKAQLSEKEKEIKELNDKYKRIEDKFAQAEQTFAKSTLFMAEFKQMKLRYDALEPTLKKLQSELAQEIKSKAQLQESFTAEKIAVGAQLQKSHETVSLLQQTLESLQLVSEKLTVENATTFEELNLTKNMLTTSQSNFALIQQQLSEEQQSTVKLTSDNAEKAIALSSSRENLVEAAAEIAQLKNLCEVQTEVETELSQELDDAEIKLSQLAALNGALTQQLQEKSAEVQGLQLELANRPAPEPLNAEPNNQQNPNVEELMALLATAEASSYQLLQSITESSAQSEAAIQALKEQSQLDQASLKNQFNELKTENQRLKNELANRPSNIPEVVEFKMPNRPVIAYAAGGFVLGGLGITATMVAAGLISLSLLAAIPIVGWAAAAGVLLAFTVVLAVKSVMNVFANRASAQVQVATEQPHVSIPVAQSNREPGVAVSFRASKSPLRANGFLSSPAPAHINDLEEGYVYDPNASYGRRHV